MAIEAFGIGTTEFAPMGLLPVIAGGWPCRPKAEFFVTGDAPGVVAGAHWRHRRPGDLTRKILLVERMGRFTIGKVMATLAPALAG